MLGNDLIKATEPASDSSRPDPKTSKEDSHGVGEWVEIGVGLPNSCGSQRPAGCEISSSLSSKWG